MIASICFQLLLMALLKKCLWLQPQRHLGHRTSRRDLRRPPRQPKDFPLNIKDSPGAPQGPSRDSSEIMPVAAATASFGPEDVPQGPVQAPQGLPRDPPRTFLKECLWLQPQRHFAHRTSHRDLCRLPPATQGFPPEHQRLPRDPPGTPGTPQGFILEPPGTPQGPPQKMRNEILYRMMVSTLQTDFISISYKSTLSQKIDLIFMIAMV